MVIKICGIKTLEEVKYCNILLPDYIGFVFAESKRKITLDKAYELYNGLNHRIKVVGVFRNQSIEEVIKIAKSSVIDLIQLHGSEDDEYVRKVKEATGLEIIKAYNKSKYADYLLLDSKNPGSGIKRDYTFKKTNVKTFLAGGIGIDNIADVMLLNPYGIDLSSSVEVNGIKNYNKMENIIRMVRTYER